MPTDAFGAQANGAPPRPPPGMQGGPPPMPPMQNGYPGGPPGQVFFPQHTSSSQNYMPNQLAYVEPAARTNLLVRCSRLANELLVIAEFLKAFTAAGCLPSVALQRWRGHDCYQAMYAMQTPLVTFAQAFGAAGVHHMIMQPAGSPWTSQHGRHRS